MNPLWILAAVAGVVALGVLVVVLRRLSSALREVRRSMDDLGEALPAITQVRGEVDEWRAAMDRTRRN